MASDDDQILNLKLVKSQGNIRSGSIFVLNDEGCVELIANRVTRSTTKKNAKYELYAVNGDDIDPVDDRDHFDLSEVYSQVMKNTKEPNFYTAKRALTASEEFIPDERLMPGATFVSYNKQNSSNTFEDFISQPELKKHFVKKQEAEAREDEPTKKRGAEAKEDEPTKKKVRDDEATSMEQAEEDAAEALLGMEEETKKAEEETKKAEEERKKAEKEKERKKAEEEKERKKAEEEAEEERKKAEEEAQEERKKAEEETKKAEEETKVLDTPTPAPSATEDDADLVRIEQILAEEDSAEAALSEPPVEETPPEDPDTTQPPPLGEDTVVETAEQIEPGTEAGGLDAMLQEKRREIEEQRELINNLNASIAALSQRAIAQQAAAQTEASQEMEEVEDASQEMEGVEEADVDQEMLNQIAGKRTSRAADVRVQDEREVKRLQDAGAGDDLINATEAANHARERETAQQQQEGAIQVAELTAIEESAEGILLGSAVGTRTEAGANHEGVPVEDSFDPHVVASAIPAENTMTTTEATHVPITEQNEQGQVAMSHEQNGLDHNTALAGVDTRVGASANAMEVAQVLMEQDAGPPETPFSTENDETMRKRSRREALAAVRAGKKAVMKEMNAAARAEEAAVKQAQKEAERQAANNASSRMDIAQQETAIQQSNAEAVEQVLALLESRGVDDRVKDLLKAEGITIMGRKGKDGRTVKIDPTNDQIYKKFMARIDKAVVAAERDALSNIGSSIQMGLPGSTELINQAAATVVRERVATGVQKIDLFAPADASLALNSVHENMREKIGEMTFKEITMRKALMDGWKNEFEKWRLDQAVLGMSQLGDGAIKSPTSTVQIASKPRKDMSETDESNMFFMYWMIRKKLHTNTKTLSWLDFFKYAAALGKNNPTAAELNWLMFGDKDGTGEGINFENFRYSDVLDAPINEDGFPKGEKLEPKTKQIIDYIIEQVPIPPNPPPNKSMTPSAGPARGQPREFKFINGRIEEVRRGTPTWQEAGKRQVEGIPSKVSNIPDPRYSMRGGKYVENVRIVTRRNPKWVPGKEDSKEYIHDGSAPAGPNDKFINEKVADVAAGSRDLSREIDRSESDLLAAAKPFKLYAPIHPQACDRYLGEKNYARLSMRPEMYMKTYSEQGYGPNDFEKMYRWNESVLRVYGPTLYAFVTDIQMQISVPVFSNLFPSQVRAEFMELNELVEELKNYQMKSVDRGTRVAGGPTGETPLDKHLAQSFDEKEDTTKTVSQLIDDEDAIIIAAPTQPPPAPAQTSNSSTEKPRGPPAEEKGAPINVQGQTLQGGTRPQTEGETAQARNLRSASPAQVIQFGARGVSNPPMTASAREMDHGITKARLGSTRSKMNKLDSFRAFAGR